MLPSVGRLPFCSTTDRSLLELFMTTPEHTPAPEAVAETIDEQALNEEKKAAVPAFSFPFKPADFAPSKKDQPYYQKSNKYNQNKSQGVAPHGTHKSMGKR